MSDAGADAVLALVETRGADATVCPSEVARALASARDDEDWRAHMEEVHGAVYGLVAAGRVSLSWRGEPMAVRVGPYRIRKAD